MALTRKLLKSLGIADDAIETIIDAHSETVDALKAESSGFAEKAARADELAAEVERLQQGAQENAGNAAKWEKEHEAFEAFKAEIAAKDAKRAKEQAYADILKSANIDPRRIPAILKVTDIDSIQFDENGALNDAEGLKANAVSEWGDFVLKTQTNAAQVDNPPSPAIAQAPRTIAEALRAKYESN